MQGASVLTNEIKENQAQIAEINNQINNLKDNEDNLAKQIEFVQFFCL